MKNYPYIPSMVQAITVLTVLKMMTKAQTSCGSGSMNGKVMYERLPNIQLQGFDDDIFRDTGPPFSVLEKCQDLCLRDRSTQNIVRACHSFDFQPGGRVSSYNGSPEYEESTCYLTQEQARPDGLGSLMLVPNSVHFTEVCLTSNRPERECPNRRYVFERHPRKKLKLAAPDVKESRASNRTACEDLCLNEFSFVCRSATFDAAMGMCALSRFTRRTHPELLEDDIDSDYLENTCLNAERRCDGLAVFIKEENKRLGGPFEVDMFTNLTLDECQGMCVRAEKFLCRSIEYDEVTKQCTLSEEDSVSQREDLGVASSPTHNFYDFVCLDSPRGSEYPDNSVTSHLFTGKRPDTAFQRYRNSRLGGEHHSEISGRSLSECLDECLRQPSFQCRSAEYSERYRTCRLTRYNQRDGMRIIYDADYDYYENLMLGGDGEGAAGGGARPGDNSVYRPGDDRYPGGSGTYRPGGSGGGRYPPSGGGGGGGGGRYPITSGSRYPPSSGGYDYDRYPGAGGRPYDRYPDERYPPRPIDRYPPPPRRPPPTDDRHPPYPPSSSGTNYHPGRLPPPRYPPASDGGDRYDDRYAGSTRYDDRYAGGGGGTRYDDRYGGGGGSRYGGTGGGSRYDDRYGVGGTRYDDRYGGGTRYGGRYEGAGDDYYAGSGGGKYGGTGGGGRYGGRYGNRYDDRYDRYNDRYGDRATSNRYDFYGGDDRYGGGGRIPFRRPFGRPLDPHRPPIDDHALGPRPLPPRRPLSPGPDGPIYDSFGGLGPARPFASRCDDGDAFKQAGTRTRMRKDYIRRGVAVASLGRCQQECVDARDFICRSFNFRDSQPAGYEGENCELSDRDTRDMEIGNPQYFDATTNYDFYERHNGRNGVDGECLDVAQVCNEDGMEFTLRTPEGFYGRIYAYGFYDRCFFRGNGGTANVLRISGAHGYPECGTQRYGDTMTNIVVVQFSDFVQTGRDKRFNLTCLFRGPGEAVVSSGFIGAGSGSPIPIEYLPAENTLSSKVRLLILYQGRPTTTIAVGDPLTFRIEAQDGYNYATDIFATNVVARDPYSGRSVQLIDRFGCPVDSFVFPELDKGRNGDSLEARFNAFKIPESNFLVFEATVRTCREGCQPAYCQTGSGRSEPSFGRKRRSLDDVATLPGNSTNVTEAGGEGGVARDESTNETGAGEPVTETTVTFPEVEAGAGEEIRAKGGEGEGGGREEKEAPEYVREMIEVFDSREELQQEAHRAEPLPETVCLSPGEYRGLVGGLLSLVAAVLTGALSGGLAYRKYWLVVRKNMAADRFSHSNFSATTGSSGSYPRTRSSGPTSGFSAFGHALHRQLPSFGLPPPSAAPTSPPPALPDLEVPCGAPGGPFEDPSEPIYTDPSLFERARSLRSVAVTPKRRRSPQARP